MEATPVWNRSWFNPSHRTALKWVGLRNADPASIPPLSPPGYPSLASLSLPSSCTGPAGEGVATSGSPRWERLPRVHPNSTLNAARRGATWELRS